MKYRSADTSLNIEPPEPAQIAMVEMFRAPSIGVASWTSIR